MGRLWCWFKTCSLSVSYNKTHVNHTHLLLPLILGSTGVNWSKEGLQMADLQGLIICHTSTDRKRNQETVVVKQDSSSVPREDGRLGREASLLRLTRKCPPNQGKLYSENFPSVLAEKNCFTPLYSFGWKN